MKVIKIYNTTKGGYQSILYGGQDYQTLSAFGKSGTTLGIKPSWVTNANNAFSAYEPSGFFRLNGEKRTFTVNTALFDIGKVYTLSKEYSDRYRIDLFDSTYLSVQMVRSYVGELFIDTRDREWYFAISTVFTYLCTCYNSDGAEVYTVENDVYPYSADGLTYCKGYGTNLCGDAFYDWDGTHEIFQVVYEPNKHSVSFCEFKQSETSKLINFCESRFTPELTADKRYQMTMCTGTLFAYDESDITDNDQGEDSDTGGGDGGYDDTTDSVVDTDLPNVNTISGGFKKVYLLSNGITSKYTTLGKFLWSSDFVDSVLKLLGASIDTIINMSILPLSYSILTLNAESPITLGNVESPITAQSLSKQFVTLDCGTLEVKNYSNTFLDYAPNTEITLYLPYIGDIPLDVSDVTGNSINVKYNIDLLTGSAVAFVTVIGDGINSVIYQYSCNIETKDIVTGADFTAMWASLISIGASSAVGAVTGGVGGAVVSGALSASGNIANAKPMYQKTNNINSNTGLLSIQKPYLKITRAIQQRPKDFNNVEGYTLEVTKLLSDLNGYGYTVVKKAVLKNMTCTQTELNMINQLLENGVYL